MIITIAPMVYPKVFETPYFLRALDLIKDKLDDTYHFIIARTNCKEEIQEFKNCIKDNYKNILILLSDEVGIIPPFLGDLFLVFRTYNRTGLYDNNKIFPVPCGYSYGCDGLFGNSNWEYVDAEKEKKSLIERDYDLFFSGQSRPDNSCFNYANNIKNKFNSIIQLNKSFASGFNLEDYYEYMRNSKICLVPSNDCFGYYESFRYFEAFESNSIVIAKYPSSINKYDHWYFKDSPAIFLNNWSELTEDLVKNLLTEDSLKKYEILNKKYFDEKISIKAISNYILNIIKSKEYEKI